MTKPSSSSTENQEQKPAHEKADECLDSWDDDLMSNHSDDLVEVTKSLINTPDLKDDGNEEDSKFLKIQSTSTLSSSSNSDKKSKSNTKEAEEGEGVKEGQESKEGEEGGRDDQSSLLSPSSEVVPYKLRWSKSKVYIHPTAFLRDNVAGYLGITQKAVGSFYLSWIPEQSVDSSPDRDSWIKLDLEPQSEDSIMVTVPSESSQSSIPTHAFSVSINSIHSLIVRPPTFSSWHGTVVINQFCGPTLPRLYFHDDESRSTQFARQTRQARLSQGTSSPLPSSWGGEALLTQLRRFAEVCPSMKDSGLFLINPSQTERDDHSTPIFADDAITPPHPLTRTSILHESLTNHKNPAAMDDFTFSILNHFSRLTQNARSAAQMVLSHRLAKPIIPHLPKPIASLANGEPEFIKWSQQAGVEGYDSARVYLAKWASIVAAQGERSRRAEVGDWDPDGSYDDDGSNALGGGFEMIHATYQVPKVRSNRAPTQPIEPQEFMAWKDDSGKLMLDESEGRRRIFQRGVAPGARKEVWMFLLRVYDWKSNDEERRINREAMEEDYKKLKNAWENDEELKATNDFLEEAHRIEIDCKRTDRRHPYFSDPPTKEEKDNTSANLDENVKNDESDQGGGEERSQSNVNVSKVGKILMTYNVWEKELGYVQGMSDLCAPLYVICEGDEVLTFFGFVKLMDRMKSHFLRDQSGMKDKLSRLQQLLLLIDPQLYYHFEKTNSLNLFFCFRWILIGFKREFEFDDVLKVWEALWTEVFGPHGDLFFALAILQSHREPMIRYLREFDEVLKYVNDIAMTLDCEQLIGQAEILYLTFKSILENKVKINEEDGKEIIETSNGKRVIVLNEELKSLI